MDAKPQRPRAVRVHDENMPPPAIPSAMPGKTLLHSRHKSTPTLHSLVQAGAVKAANKKVLGEANANARIAQPAKDDSAIGKKGSTDNATELVKPVAALSRPATRPLASKSFSSQNVLSVTLPAAPAVKSHLPEPVPVLASEPMPKLMVKKKSTKVFKEVEVPAEVEVKKPAALAPAQQRQKKQSTEQVEPQGGVPVQHQEVRKTETVPLRDEPAPRPQPHPIALDNTLPPGFATEDEYMLYLESQASQLQLQQQNLYDQGVGIPSQYLASSQGPVPQYYDEEEDEYFYEEGFTTRRSFGLRGESTGGITTVIAPKQSEKVQQELAAAKDFVENTRTPEDIEDEQWDTSMVAEYGDEIFEYMRELEVRMAPNPRYMEQQQEIQWSMRSVLVDWVVQVHQRFNLLPETLFLTINYIDRFLSCKIVSLGKLQLVGATAIFVAAKYEEVNCPTIAEIIYMVDGGYTPDELLKAERFMLSMLQFELGWPGPMSFLRRISKADDYDLETRTLAKYFLEVTVMDERFVGCTPSFLAAGAHCMARMMLRKGEWSPAHVYYSNYTYSQLRQLLNAMLECCEDPEKHHTAVFDKYSDKRYKKASTFVKAEMSKGFSLPRFASTRGSSVGPVDSVAGWLK